MTFERSKNKMRPTLVRLTDVSNVKAVRNPSAGRGAGGLFAAKNRIGINAREKNAVSRLLGRGVGDETSLAVARDAARLFAGVMREMPHDNASVRQMVALQARHTALASFFTALAAARGLDTPEGLAADERAIKHGQRAERLAVTALDLANKYAATSRADSDSSGPPAGYVDVDEDA
jgi:hypothetical protein